MASPWRAVLTALGAMLLAISSLGGSYAVAVVVAALGCAFAVGWPALVGVPAQRGSSIVIAAAALAAVLVVVISHSPAYLSLVLAFGVTAAFLQQMLRRDERHRLVEGMSATVTGIVVVTSGSGWILAFSDRVGDEAILIALAALVLAAAITALPSNTLILAGVAGLTGAGFGVGFGVLMPNMTLLTGFLAGLVSGGMMALTHVVLGGFPAVNRWRVAMAAALLPVLVLGIPLHLIAAIG